MEYRDIVGLPGYRIGLDGSIWSKRKRVGHHGICISDEWVPKAIYVTKNGYSTTTVKFEGKKDVLHVHVLVLSHFGTPKPFPKAHCCHNDGNPQNNSLDNLRWDTAAGNNADKVKHGRGQAGRQNSQNTLTEAQVIEIIDKLKNKAKNCQLAQEYGVHPSNISAIKVGRSWPQIPRG